MKAEHAQHLRLQRGLYEKPATSDVLFAFVGIARAHSLLRRQRRFEEDAEAG
jgi:hypothetical protein